MMYYFEQDAPQDFTIAWKWFKLGADQRETDAHNSLATSAYLTPLIYTIR